MMDHILAKYTGVKNMTKINDLYFGSGPSYYNMGEDYHGTNFDGSVKIMMDGMYGNSGSTYWNTNTSDSNTYYVEYYKSDDNTSVWFAHIDSYYPCIWYSKSNNNNYVIDELIFMNNLRYTGGHGEIWFLLNYTNKEEKH